MKTKLLAITLALITLLASMTLAVSGAEKVDVPTPGGRHLFNADAIMYPGDEGTKYDGAFVHPDVWNPVDQKYEHWTHATFERTTYKGVDCVKIGIDPESPGQPVLDFNYYQWNAGYIKPTLDNSKYSYLKIKYAYAGGADMDYIKFHASAEFEDPAVTTWNNAITTEGIVNGEGEWKEVILNVGDLIFEDGTAWSENNTRQFRLYLFERLDHEANPDACVYLAGFGFFETEEAAKAWDCVTGGGVEEDSAANAAAKAEAEKAAAEAAAKAEAEKAAAEAAAKAEAEKAAAEAAAKAEAEKAAAEAAAKAEEEKDAVEVVATAEETTEEVTAEETVEVTAEESEEVTEDATVEESEEITEEVTEEVAAEETEEITEEVTEEVAAEETEEITEEETNNFPVVPVIVLVAVIVVAAIVVIAKKKGSH